MRAVKFLHKMLSKSCKTMHAKRLSCLTKVVNSLLRGGNLALTSMGRNLTGPVAVKHKIKQVDRLLANKHLASENLEISSTIVNLASSKQHITMVLVDWSPCITHQNHILRASILCQDDALTVYEEVHPQRNLHNFKVQKNFLSNLSKVFGDRKDVCIITDAGFTPNWHELVSQRGWFFLGRVRSNKYYRAEGEDRWHHISDIYSLASNKPRYHGKVELTKAHKVSCHLYTYKESKEEKKKYKRIIRSKKLEEEYKKQADEPWLLATNLPKEYRKAKFIVNCYKRRMQIEHLFRDTKDQKWGLGLSRSKTRDFNRLNTLLLIGRLAAFLCWLIGRIAERHNWHYHFQSNSIKKKRVVSLIFLALQVCNHYREKIKVNDLTNMLKEVKQGDHGVSY